MNGASVDRWGRSLSNAVSRPTHGRSAVKGCQFGRARGGSANCRFCGEQALPGASEERSRHSQRQLQNSRGALDQLGEFSAFTAALQGKR